MKAFLTAAATLALVTTAHAQEADAPVPSPGEIVNAAPVEDWVIIDPEDLVVMTLQPLADGTERKVVMQLIGEPFSQGWVENIRTLARAQYWDGSAILRVQDNYVVQWGQPDPGMGVEPKPVPEGLNVMDEGDYTSKVSSSDIPVVWTQSGRRAFDEAISPVRAFASRREERTSPRIGDPHSGLYGFVGGLPVALSIDGDLNMEESFPIGPEIGWPIHCYGMVGVGRNFSPDTGDGSQLYTVIGHAPRHLDRNIAVVGRIISGIEHLSSLPRGSGALGFYEDPEKRVPIVSIRMAADLPEDQIPRFEYLSTASASFAAYAAARANRRDPFFIVPAGGADICNIPVPVRPFEVVDE